MPKTFFLFAGIVFGVVSHAQNTRLQLAKTLVLPAHVKLIKPDTNFAKALTPTPGSQKIKTFTRPIKLPEAMVFTDPRFTAPGITDRYALKFRGKLSTSPDSTIVLLAPRGGKFRGVYVEPRVTNQLIPGTNVFRREFDIKIGPETKPDLAYAALKDKSWKVSHDNQGLFYLFSLASGQALSIIKAANGSYEAVLQQTGRNANTQFVFFGSFLCYKKTMWIYHPNTKTFLSRKAVSGGIKLVAIPSTEVARGLGALDGSLDWDFGSNTEYFNSPLSGRANSDRGYTVYQSVPVEYIDNDSDGYNSIECGGNDCDDNDASRYPGGIEVCDRDGKDEDCDPITFGNNDRDRDGYIDINCFNRKPDGTIEGGTDCDDLNPAIIPGAMKYISDTQVEVCGAGICNVETGYRAVRQPNGTAIVVPK